jgi:Ca2+/Na+ antiporter
LECLYYVGVSPSYNIPTKSPFHIVLFIDEYCYYPTQYVMNRKMIGGNFVSIGLHGSRFIFTIIFFYNSYRINMGWITGQVDVQFFFLLGSVNYPWFYTYDELLSTLRLSGVDCLCSCVYWTTIIFYSNISMNTYFPCPRNCKMLGKIDYSRNCSNFLGFFSFLLSIVEYLEIFHSHLFCMFTSYFFPTPWV